MMKGIYHSHSEFSYDGVKTLREISEWGKERNFNFIILTEHNDDFSVEKFCTFYDQCQRNSTEVLLIPGIEYEFIINKKIVHVGVIGLDIYLDITKSPIPLKDFLDAVRKNGGVSVLHHPFRIMDVLDSEAICKFDFIEVWNVVHDIRYSPNKEIIRKAGQSGFQGKYLASRDVHYFKDKDEFPHVVLMNGLLSKSPEKIIEALLLGHYDLTGKMWYISPNGTFEPSKGIYRQLPIVSLFHQLLYERIRKYYNRTIKTPPPKWLVRLIK